MTPIIGAWVADEFWGRLKTIQVAIAFAMVGHIVLIIASLPQVIVHPNGALGCFIVGLVLFGIGVGGFKYRLTFLIVNAFIDTLIGRTSLL